MYKEIDIDDIAVPEYLVRELGEEQLKETEDSIAKKYDLINDLIVNDVQGEGSDYPGQHGKRYRLIGGYRRYTILRKLRWDNAPCKVHDHLDDETARLLGIHDNMQRKQYTSRELADIYTDLLRLHELSEVAQLLNKRPAEIRRVIATKSLSEELVKEAKEKIPDERTRETVLQLLPTLPDDDKRMQAIQIIKDRFADEFDARKIIKVIIENPNEEPEVVVKREFSVAGLVGVQLKLTIASQQSLDGSCCKGHDTKGHVGGKIRRSTPHTRGRTSPRSRSRSCSCSHRQARTPI